MTTKFDKSQDRSIILASYGYDTKRSTTRVLELVYLAHAFAYVVRLRSLELGGYNVWESAPIYNKAEAWLEYATEVESIALWDNRTTPSAIAPYATYNA